VEETVRHLSIRATFLGVFGLMSLSTVLLVLLTLKLDSAQEDLKSKQEIRYRSYLLADELRQSSDDLTRLARTYVVTGDPAYEQQYNDILDIRNGKKPRPQEYYRIYWDFVAADGQKPRPDGATIALQELMKQAGFTDAEFAKLREAQANSDALVKTEVIAMNAVKGLFDDGKGNFTVHGAPNHAMARDLMHNAAYHRYKAQIMKPVDEFFVLLDQRTSKAVAEAQETTLWQRLVIANLIFMALAIFGSGWAIYVKVSKPLAGMRTEILAVASTRNLTRRLNQSFNDEVGEIARAVNHTLDTFSETVRGIDRTSEQLDQSAHVLTESSSHISDGAQKQQEAAAAMSAGIEQLTVSVSSIAESANQAAGMAQRSDEVAVEGAHIVEQTVNGIQSIAQIVGAAVEEITALEAQSREISSVTNVIREIADQTNLLALNAAIEAARAGEQGRGFAVVADEVRKLAERTSGSTSEIAQMVGNIQGRMLEAIRRMEACQATVGQTVEQAGRAGAVMEQTRKESMGVREVVHGISNALNEQKSASNEVARNLETIAQMVEENSRSIGRVTDNARELENLAGQMKTAVHAFTV
jgi:methyl-accepting chemotaxis protein